jgi:hypothetical protein
MAKKQENQPKPGLDIFKTAAAFTKPEDALKYVAKVQESAKAAAANGGLSNQGPNGKPMCFVDITRLLGFSDTLKRVAKKAKLEDGLTSASELLKSVTDIDQDVLQSGAMVVGYINLGPGKTREEYVTHGVQKLKEYKGADED